MLLSTGAGITNVSASHHDPEPNTYETLWVGHRLTKRQQIHLEHKYFYHITHKDVYSTKWYQKHYYKILQYLGDEPGTVTQNSFGHFYTQPGKDFVLGYNDATRGTGGYYVRSGLIRHHILTRDYKTGWVMGFSYSPGDKHDGFTAKNIKASLNDYHLIKYGPTRRQIRKWAHFEHLNMSPTAKQANDPQWYLKHYRQDNHYYINHDENISSMNRSLFVTRQGHSFDDAYNYMQNFHNNVRVNATARSKHPSYRYLIRHGYNPSAYKAGWIVGAYDDYTQGAGQKATKQQFAKWIHNYNLNRYYND